MFRLIHIIMMSLDKFRFVAQVATLGNFFYFFNFFIFIVIALRGNAKVCQSATRFLSHVERARSQHYKNPNIPALDEVLDGEHDVTEIDLMDIGYRMKFTS